MNRINEIEKRLSTIKDLLTQDGADVDALSNETDALIEERKGLVEKAEKRSALLDKIGNGVVGVQKRAFDDGNREEITSENVHASKEYRSAWQKALRGVSMNDAEKRAFNVAGGAAVIPTEIASEIITKARNAHPILNEITMLNVNGNVKFAVENTIEDADIHTELATISAKGDALVEVTLSAYEVTKLIQISAALSSMSAPAFEAWITGMLADSIGAKVADLLINGTGSSEPKGIAHETFANKVEVASAKTLTTADVLNMVGLLPACYDASAKFVMAKRTLFNDFMPLMDSAKNRIVLFENGQYYIQGYPVVIEDKCAEHTAYLGDLTKIVANMSEEIGVVAQYDINTNSNKFLGKATFDCKCALTGAFVQLAKASA